MKRHLAWGPWCAAVAGGIVFVSCGAGRPVTKASPGGSIDQNSWPVDDRTMCGDWRKHPELEVEEVMGPGARKPNVRRIFRVAGEGESQRRVIACREVDTNLDGIKDIMRTFNAKGEAVHEEQDTDYDGRVDTWLSFVAGRIAEAQLDTNHDGWPDVWKYYIDGNLSRIKRDRNFDGEPDVWEIYNNGRLDRVGVDTNFDGHVDRWDRDQLALAAADEAERRARAEMEATTGDAGARPADAAK